jgi:hypothetical protein
MQSQSIVEFSKVLGTRVKIPLFTTGSSMVPPTQSPEPKPDALQSFEQRLLR